MDLSQPTPDYFSTNVENLLVRIRDGLILTPGASACLRNLFNSPSLILLPSYYIYPLLLLIFIIKNIFYSEYTHNITSSNMRLLFILFAVLLVFTNALPGGYTAVDADEVESSTTLQELLEFAEQEFIKDAVATNSITDADLTFSRITSVSQQVVGGLNVRYNVVFTDSDGKDMYVTLVVFYQPWTGVKELTSYSINIKPQTF